MKIPTEKAPTGGQNSPQVVAIKKEVDETLGDEGRAGNIHLEDLFGLSQLTEFKAMKMGKLD